MATAMATASVKTEPKTEPFDEYNFIFETVRGASDVTATSTASVAGKPRRRFPGPTRPPLKQGFSKPVLTTNRRRLGGVLRGLVRSHNWREASGVLSTILRGVRSGEEESHNWQAAMEIQKRCGAGNYQMVIKQIYDIWMSKLSWRKKEEKKKCLVQLELALFYLKQGNLTEAHTTLKLLIQDLDSARVPTVDLIYGLILYQIWYTDLLKELPRKGFIIDMPMETKEADFNDDYEETEMVENSSDHNAVEGKTVKYSYRCDSESSVCDGKTVEIDRRKSVPRKQSSDDFPANGFYINSGGMKEEMDASANHVNNIKYSSIFFAQGLDSSLLPLRLKHSTGNLEQSIDSYRRFVNEQYRDAVKHLRLALYSTPSLLEALLPLIQLLLLGDRVEEALEVLEKSCSDSNIALPFRLRATLLEAFHSNQATLISRSSEEALKRDPTCDQSLKRLIRMHITGKYSSILLLELIASHLDAAIGDCSIWGEFASCFLKILNAAISECEEHISTNIRSGKRGIRSATKIPKVLTEGRTRDLWKVRCRWWMTRHFSNSAYLSEMQVGDWKLLTCKAACAAHLYGPTFEFVISVLHSLKKEEEKEHLSFLFMHMERSMKLHGALG